MIHAMEPKATVEAMQLLLQNEQQLPINPSSLIPTDDGLIIVGNSGTTAWAAKMTRAGNVLWTHRVEKPASAESNRFLRVNQPTFNCGAAMPDGSVWLAGATTGPKSLVGLISHLDRNGRVLSEDTILPPNDASETPFTNTLNSCVRWRDGIAIAGSTSVQKPQAATPPNAGGPLTSRWSPAYWLLVLNAAGLPEYNGIVPAARHSTIRAAGLTLLSVAEDLILTASTNDSTEVVLVTSAGVVKGETRYPNGAFIPVRSMMPDRRIQLFGSFVQLSQDPSRTATSHSFLITLSDDLKELRRQEAGETFSANMVYGMPSGSLALFGAEVHEIGERYTSQIVQLDSELHRKETYAPRRDSISDAGMIYAAAPLDSTGRFVVATVAVVKGFPDHPVHITNYPGFLRGAVLDFVKLK